MRQLDKVKLYAIVLIMMGFGYISWGRYMDHKEALAKISLSQKQYESELAWANLEMAQEQKPWYCKMFSEKREYEPGSRRNRK